MPIRYVSYIRVSTRGQQRSGLGIEAQRAAISAHIAASSGKLVNEHVEQESGRRSDRPELAKALAACRVHRCTLIIAKIDRLSRSVSFLSALMDSGVEFVATDNPAANRLTLHVLAAVSEAEAKAISERTRAALAAAKRRGTKLGGFRGRVATEADRKLAATAKSAMANARALDLAPTVRDLQAEGVTSFRAIAVRLTSLGISTPGGIGKDNIPTGHGAACWSGMQVKRLLARLATIETPIR